MNQTVEILADEKGYKQQRITLKPKAKNGVIHYDEIKKLVNKYSEDAEKKGVSIYVRGRNILRNTTLKGMNEATIEDYTDEYFSNVGDPEKFKTYYYVQIILTKGNKPVQGRQSMFQRKR